MFIDHKWQLEQCTNIARRVCDEHNISWMDMISTRKARKVVVARHTYFYLAHRGTKASLITIGRAIDKDHTTVMNALNMLQKNEDRKPLYRCGG